MKTPPEETVEQFANALEPFMNRLVIQELELAAAAFESVADGKRPVDPHNVPGLRLAAQMLKQRAAYLRAKGDGR